MGQRADALNREMKCFRGLMPVKPDRGPGRKAARLRAKGSRESGLKPRPGLAALPLPTLDGRMCL